MVIFDSIAATVNSESFGSGIGGEFFGARREYHDLPYAPFAGPKRAPYSATDLAYEAGFTAASEDECPVTAPAHYSPAEVAAFDQGATFAAKQTADWDANLIEMAEERELIRMCSAGMSY